MNIQEVISALAGKEIDNLYDCLHMLPVWCKNWPYAFEIDEDLNLDLSTYSPLETENLEYYWSKTTIVCECVGGDYQEHLNFHIEINSNLDERPLKCTHIKNSY